MKVTSLHSNAKDIEQLFLLGKFQKCLRMAHTVVTQTQSPPQNHQSTQSYEHQQEYSIIRMCTPLQPLSLKIDVDDDDDDGDDDVNDATIQRRNDLETQSEKPSPPEKEGCRKVSSYSISMTQSTTPMDRIVCVALQCIYELLCHKDTPVDTHVVSVTTTTAGSSHPSRPRQLSRMVAPFLQIYEHEEGTLRTKNHPPPLPSMPVELCVIWVQFCVSTKSFQSSTLKDHQHHDHHHHHWRMIGGVTACELLYHLFSHRKRIHQHPDTPQRHKTMDWINAQCQDLLSLWVLQICPFVNSSTVKQLFQIVDSSQPPSLHDVVPLVQLEPIEFSEIPAIDPIATTIFQLTQFQIQHDFLQDIILDLMDHLQKMLLVDTTSTPSTLPHLPSSSPPTPTLEHPIPPSTSWKSWTTTLWYDRIVHPLWYHDDRWIHRGQVLTVGVLSYMTWKRKHRVVRSSKYVMGAVFLTPARELWNAISSSDDTR